MEKFLFKKVEMWVVLLLLILGVLWTIALSWAIRYQLQIEDEAKSGLGVFGPAVKSITDFPATVRDVLTGKGGKADLIAKEQRFDGQTGFKFNYDAGSRPDLGYVLVNRYDGNQDCSVSELWDLNTQEKVHTWSFAGVDAIWDVSNLETIHTSLPVDQAASRFRNLHALLNEKGYLYNHSPDSPMVIVDACSRLSIFQDKAVYHHTIEKDHAGNFWVPKRIEPKSVKFGGEKFLDDGITLISPDGKVLLEKSIVQLLDDNGLGYLIYGKGEANEDPIHLNDIQPTLTDGRFWKQGDVFLSLRHQSMIVLYRPSTNQVIWHKQGPWIQQHDVDVINDHQISIFNNNAVTENKTDWVVRGVNNVLIYDFATNQVTSPWQAGFEKLEVRTKTEGRGEIVGNELFVEETNYGRLIQFLPDGTVNWQFINRADDGKVYLLNWSRLISRQFGDQVRDAIAQRSCP